ncbi:MAG: tetratricopeptide repeat protein [Planctomycetaceae bacterium]|nr:tetratricopeptide repeat protein [Planctomycetaceae bacterium]
MSDVSDIQQQRAIEAAQGYLVLELPDAALRRLGIFQDAESTPPAVEQLRGEVYRQKEDYEKALKHFERVPTDEGNHLELRMSMAWCFKRIGRLEKAIESMKAAYRESPKSAIVLYNLACYYSLAGEKEEALSWLGRAIRMDNSYRLRVPRETDFDPIRNDQEFLYLMQLSEPKKTREKS